MSDIPKDAATPTETSDFKPPETLSPKGIAAIQGDTGDVNKEWKDLGIVDVPVSSLPMPEDVSGPQDFNHHITYDDAISATKQLPEVQKQVAAGKTREDFWNEDQRAGVDYAQGKERVYDLFYGNDPIALEKIGDHYDILSGRHRIYAAKELGLATIPAHVRERT
jgi:hypothetical protein